MKKSILKPKNNVLCGAYMPPHIDSALSLRAMVDQTTKSAIIRKLLTDWHEKEGAPSKEKLLATITKSIQYSWASREVTENDFTAFLSSAKEYLRKKRIASSDIKLILSNIKE